MKERPRRTPLQQAVGLLSRREHSQKELRRKLSQRGAEVHEIDAAVARLDETGLQDERRFADSLIRQRVAAGYGPLYLRAELGTHALPEGVIEAALEGVEVDWDEVAAALLQRRFPQGTGEPRDHRRALALLQRRGFDGECIRRLIR